MLKVSYFTDTPEHGPVAVPLFSPSDGVFEKVAAPKLLPEVVRYISELKPQADTQYVLVNALGASEYYGSNVNGDAFPEAALIHAPDDWKGVPIFDRIKAKDWPYGFPTFYDSKPFLHHRNKDFAPHNHPSYGTVELSAWNPHMKRVELVICVEKDKCVRLGGTGLWDKLKQGQFPDVSMGSKVPFDTCSVCLDWKAFREAQATFKPGKHKHPGEAVLEVHRALIAKGKKGIRGLSITRKDYCEHASKMMNRILPDGKKVFVYNDYPKFFDISFVFIGADKTAKTMLKLADASGRVYSFVGGAEIAEKLGYQEVDEKIAADKEAKKKEGEIVKHVVPSQFAGKAVPVLTDKEPSIPLEMLNLMGGMDLKGPLSTLTGLGIVLRPREFQRIILVSAGNKDFADKLDDMGAVFSKSKDSLSVDLDEKAFNPALARLLLPLLAMRSGLGPIIEKRIVVIAGEPSEKKEKQSSLSSDVLHKIGAAYNGYRSAVMDLIANSQSMLESVGGNNVDLSKLANAQVEDVFTPLAYNYFKHAFLDEMAVDSVGDGIKTGGLIATWRGTISLKEHVDQ